MLPEEKVISSPDGLENDAQNGINISYSVKDAQGCSRFEMRNIKGRQVPLQAIKGSLQSRLVGIHKDLLAKNVLMTVQRDFRLGNSPS